MSTVPTGGSCHSVGIMATRLRFPFSSSLSDHDASPCIDVIIMLLCISFHLRSCCDGVSTDGNNMSECTKDDILCPLVF